MAAILLAQGFGVSEEADMQLIRNLKKGLISCALADAVLKWWEYRALAEQIMTMSVNNQRAGLVVARDYALDCYNESLVNWQNLLKPKRK